MGPGDRMPHGRPRNLRCSGWGRKNTSFARRLRSRPNPLPRATFVSPAPRGEREVFVSEPDNDAKPSVLVRYWGTRGAMPSPGPETVVFGGNTACIEILYGGRRWILDAGTGIRSLGATLKRPAQPVEACVLLSHYHWDHVQGLPFFSPLHIEGTKLTVMGPVHEGYGVSQMVQHVMAPRHFPVKCDYVMPQMTAVDLTEPSFEAGGCQVDTMVARHSARTLGFRLSIEGRRICYFPDNELAGDKYDAGPDWRSRLEAFVGDADLLIHDAMFLDSEYAKVEGWGHSTVEQATALAEAAGVKRLVLFHHAPDRSDSALIDIVSRQRQRLTSSAGAPKVSESSSTRYHSHRNPCGSSAQTLSAFA